MDVSFVEPSVAMGEGDTVVIRRSASSPATVARALDVVMGEDGQPTKILLDRRVHADRERWRGPWKASGALVTLLEKAEASGNR